jgi:hypothetical protein
MFNTKDKLSMQCHLFISNNTPSRIAVSKTISSIDDYENSPLFFLDFSRKLKVFRWFGLVNNYFGFPIALHVPVIHQCEEIAAGYVINVGIKDPYFKNILNLWNEHYPQKNPSPNSEYNELQIIVDFADQFPEDA